MQNCVVCRAFPDHKGTHYTMAELYASIRQGRVRSKNSARWCKLRGCFTIRNNPVMATGQMTNYPQAYSVAPGYWICEKTEEFDAFIDDTSQRIKRDALTDSPGNKLDKAQESVRATAAADSASLEDNIGPDIQEGMKMTELVSQGHLAWSKSGLGVDVFTSNSDGKGADITAIKKALRDFEPSEKVTVTITEVLGRGNAWISLKVERGDQGQLLIATGSVIDYLTDAGVCSEVLLTDNSGADMTRG